MSGVPVGRVACDVELKAFDADGNVHCFVPEFHVCDLSIVLNVFNVVLAR